MKQRHVWLAGSMAAAVLVLTAVARADRYSSGSSPPASQRAQPTALVEARVSGRVIAIDYTPWQAITIMGPYQSEVFKITAASKIAPEGKTGATLADLKVGDRVDVSFHMDGYSAMADLITRIEPGSSPEDGRAESSR